MEEFLLNNITLYPNPATEKVTISSETSELKEISISNLSGQALFQTSSTEANIDLDLSTLPKGVYIISIEMGSAKASRKLVIQ